MTTETENTEDLKDIKVSQEKDGSVTVDLPASMAGDDHEDDDDNDEGHAEGGEADSSESSQDDSELSESRRNKRRAKRELQKRDREEKEKHIVHLRRQNQELLERMAVLERKTHSSELVQIDKAIEDHELKLQYAKLKMSEAVNAQDGDAMAKAQDMWYETRRKVEALKTFKEQAVKNTAQQPTDSGATKQYVSEWMDTNDWYDPDGDDEDSQIAKIIDQKLTKEGWNPNTKDYWKELDRRLQKRLPHRYSNDQDEYGSRSSRPRSVVTGTGRESINGSGRRNSFVLSPEQVRAMKDAGFWDDSEKRNKMIKRYAMEARNSRN